MRPHTFLVPVIVLISASCATHDETMRASVERDLWASLAVGDSSEKIELVLKRKGFPFDFDTFKRRYQTYFDPKEPRQVKWRISIYIYVDDEKRLMKIEVQNVYTYL